MLLLALIQIGICAFSAQYPLSIELEDIIYTCEKEGSGFVATDLTETGKTKTHLVIKPAIIVDGNPVAVDRVEFKSDAVTEIDFSSYIGFADAYTNLPNLKTFNFTGESLPNGPVTLDGVCYENDSQGDPYRLYLYPPAKEDESFIIPENITDIKLNGNKYLRSITIPSTSTIWSMPDNFPELEEIKLSGSSDQLQIFNGGLYRLPATNGDCTLIHFPVKYSDTFIVYEKANGLHYWPNVKNIIVDSPYIGLRAIILGDNVESLVFSKPTYCDNNVEWRDGSIDTRYSQIPDKREREGQIYGKNLKKVVLPENVGFSPTLFAIVKLLRHENNRYYYQVSYPESLEYVKGGWFVYTNYELNRYDTYSYIGIHDYLSAQFSGDPATTITSNDDHVIYPSKIDFHLEPTNEHMTSDFHSGNLRIHYDKILHNLDNLDNLSEAALSLKVDWEVLKQKGLSDFFNLRSLDVYFPEDFTGLGNSLMGQFFTSEDSSMPEVVQYKEDGSAETLCRPAFLSNIRLYGNVEYIPFGFFSNFISLESVSLPASLYTVGDKAFYGCSKLNELSVLADYPPVAYDETFKGVRTGMTHLLVSEESIDLYKSDDIWKTFFIESTETQPLTINKSILDAGEIETDFSGIFGEYATLHVSVNPGYKFIGWYDKNLSFLGNANELKSIVYEPTVVNAIFLPSEDSDEVSYNWQSNGALSISFPSDNEAYMYRVSCYDGSISGSPEVVETFPASADKHQTRSSGNDFDVVINGLSKERDYNIVIEVINEKEEIIKAYLKNVLSSVSFVDETSDDSIDVKLDGQLLTINSSSRVLASAYTVDGYQIFCKTIDGQCQTNLPNGIIILVVNDKTYKLLVQ